MISETKIQVFTIWHCIELKTSISECYLRLYLYVSIEKYVGFLKGLSHKTNINTPKILPVYCTLSMACSHWALELTRHIQRNLSYSKVLHTPSWEFTLTLTFVIIVIMRQQVSVGLRFHFNCVRFHYIFCIGDSHNTLFWWVNTTTQRALIRYWKMKMDIKLLLNLLSTSVVVVCVCCLLWCFFFLSSLKLKLHRPGKH